MCCFVSKLEQFATGVENQGQISHFSTLVTITYDQNLIGPSLLARVRSAVWEIRRLEVWLKEDSTTVKNIVFYCGRKPRDAGEYRHRTQVALGAGLAGHRDGRHGVAVCTTRPRRLLQISRSSERDGVQQTCV